ncbi:hypothetical protein Fmac_016373 [Flemingia macrophylla]|uniref:Ribosomal protein S8 n=1 Tax=Flemingia macrophylla TaxID=520843 RepID=A0ABD1MH68_9FABA
MDSERRQEFVKHVGRKLFQHSCERLGMVKNWPESTMAYRTSRIVEGTMHKMTIFETNYIFISVKDKLKMLTQNHQTKSIRFDDNISIEVIGNYIPPTVNHGSVMVKIELEEEIEILGVNVGPMTVSRYK